MINLKAEYGATYRIALDESAEIDGQSREDRAWLYQIPAKHGHIYIHGENTLGAYCGKPNVIARLLVIPGVTVRQRGDREVNVSFEPALLEQVAQLLGARKRRVVSEAERERLRQQTAGFNAAKANCLDKTGGSAAQDAPVG